MTILIDPTVASALSLAGTSNNPIVAYDNAADDGTLSTSGGTEVEAAANAGTGTTYDAWIATGTGGGLAFLQLVLPSAQSLSFVAITGHNIATLGANVRVEYSLNSGGTWLDSGAGVETPTDNQAIAFYFDAVSTDYWRIRVSDAVAVDVEIAVALFSNPITIGQRIYQGYAPPITPNVVELQSNVSEGGNLLGSAVVRKGSRASAALTHIDPTFLRGASWTGFQSHFNGGGGFFWLWRPTKYDDAFYAWRDGAAIAPDNSGPKDYMSFDMGMRFYDQP